MLIYVFVDHLGTDVKLISNDHPDFVDQLQGVYKTVDLYIVCALLKCLLTSETVGGYIQTCSHY